MNKLKSALKEFYLLFTDANSFFKGKHEASYSKALGFYVGFMTVPLVLYLCYEFYNFFINEFNIEVSLPIIFFALVLMPLFLISRPFFQALFIHMGAIVVGANKNYRSSFNAVCYGSTVSAPYFILFVILNFLFLSFNYTPSPNVVFALVTLFAIYWIHVLFTIVQGIKHYHKLSSGKALFSALFLIIIMLFIVLISALLILLFYFGAIYFFEIYI